MARTILILSPLKKMSGNFSTAIRLRNHFVSQSYTCLLEETLSFGETLNFLEFLHDNKVDFVISLHAYHSGRVLTECPVPYVVILGGTDVHEYTKDIDKYRLMGAVLHKASKIVAFGKSLVVEVFRKWPDLKWSDIAIIPQAVSTDPSAFSIHHYLKDSGKFPSYQETGSNHGDLKIFIVVGGIRSVKEPMFLLETFSDWHINNKRKAFLVFVGPLQLQHSYGQEFLEMVDRCSGIVYVNGLTSEDTHAAIRDSFALVNSSRSEGMASAILEAMDLGTAVIARDIPANCELIEHRRTGLLYHTPQDFVMMAEELLTSPDLRTILAEKAKEQTEANHSLETECTSYLSLIEESFQENPEINS